METKMSREQQIIEVARKNENRISYTVALDILKDCNSEQINEQYLSDIFEHLAEEGIVIEAGEDSEDYGKNDSMEDGMYIPADVHITPRNMTIDTLVDRLQYDEIDLEPAFQRKSGLWTAVQQSRLIESLMLKIPVPTFYFNAANEDKWVVIDGLQRLTTLYNFFVTKELKLESLEYLSEFNGFGIDDLPRQYYRRIRETQVQSYTIEKGTPEDIVYNIFKRINTGGLILSPQEIRHALYQGKVTKLIKELAENKNFLEVTGKVLRTERMMDCEYVTRYLAFTQLDYKKEYTGNIDSFLIKAMKTVNNYSGEEIEQIKLRFEGVMYKCYQLLGKYAFRKISVEGKRGPINKALFEMWTLCIYRCSDDEYEKLIQKREMVLSQFREFIQRPDMVTAIKAGDKYSVVNRIAALEHMIKEILND